MGQDFQKRYNERARYLEGVRYRNATVDGREDYDFEQHLAPKMRGTYEGQALIDRWRKECFNPNYLAELEFQVADLAELAAWEQEENERFRKRNGLPPSPAARRAAIEAKRAARTAANDEPPTLPELPADDAEETTTATTATERDDLTLFGSLKRVQQVKPLR